MKKLFIILSMLFAGSLAAQGFVRQLPGVYLNPRDMVLLGNDMYVMVYDNTGTWGSLRVLKYDGVGDTSCTYAVYWDGNGAFEKPGILKTSDNNLLLCYERPYPVNPGYTFVKISPSGTVLDSAYIDGTPNPNNQTSFAQDGSDIYFTAREPVTYANVLYKMDQNLNIVAQAPVTSNLFPLYQDLKLLPNHNILLITSDYWTGGIKTFTYDANCNLLDSTFFNIHNGYSAMVWKYSQHIESDSILIFSKYTSTDQFMYRLNFNSGVVDSTNMGGIQIFCLTSFPNNRYLCGFRDQNALYAAILDANYNVLNYTPIAYAPVAFDLEYNNGIIGMLTQMDQNNFSQIIMMDTTLNPIVGNLSGSVFHDLDSNCINVPNTDVGLNSSVVTATSGNFTFYAIPTGGVYGMNVYEDNYTVSSTDPLGFHDVCNNSLNVNVVGGNNYPDQDFFKKQYGHDVYVDLHAGTFSAPNQSGTLHIETGNYSASTMNSYTLKLVGDTAVDYISASVNPTSVSGDTLIWNFGTTLSGTSQVISVSYSVPPTSPAGTPLQFASHMYAMLPFDENVVNNDDTLQTVVLNSFDPNDKSVSPVGTGPQGFIRNNQQLEYMVRFQNTGNYPAANIYVLDELDPALDISTLRVTSASHPYTASIVNPNTLRVDFKNIFLADSNSNEPASHGYFTYTIDLIPNQLPGTVITNEAGIYFDFNPPVITNQTLNTIQYPVGIEDNDEITDGRLFPNPANEFVTLELPDDLLDCEEILIRIQDLQGRVLSEQMVTAQTNIVLNVSTFETGMYVVTAGKMVYRFVKR